MSTRRYVSERRTSSARETRRRILAAAQQELGEVGYHAMTIGALARRAGVSPQTIYNAIGSKAAVIKALYDVLLAGDDEPVPIGQRPEFAAILQQPDGPATLRAYLAFGQVLYARAGALLGVLLADGPGADAELRDFVATIEGERRSGNAAVLQNIEDRFGWSARLPREQAVDLLWSATSFELADRLVRRCGWSQEDYERWLADMLIFSLYGNKVADES